MSDDSTRQTITVNRGDTTVDLRVPTAEELNDGVIHAALAVGALRGLASHLATQDDPEGIGAGAREIADGLQRFVEIIDPTA